MHVDIIEPYFVDEPVDFVYHFASPASPIDYLRLPLHTLKVGSYGTHHTLGLAKAHRARFVTASTSEVYGDPKVHPQPESYWGHVNPIGPRGVYDEAKRYAEALTMAYHRQQGVDTAIVRIFNTYGPRMRPHDGRAIPTFLRQALQDRPITVFGDGSQTRSFCYVADLIDGIIRLAESGYHHPVNIGNPNEFTLLELAHAVIDVTGSRSEIVHEALPDGRPAGPPARHHPRPRDPRLGAEGRAARGPAPHAGGVRHGGAHRGRRVLARPTDRGWAPACPICTHAARNARTCDTPAALLAPEASMPETSTKPPQEPAPRRRRRSTLPPTDIRRKRPPALSFLLRMDTLRRLLPRRLAAGARLRRRVRGDHHRADAQGACCATGTGRGSSRSTRPSRTSRSRTWSPRCCSPARACTPSARSARACRGSSPRCSR